MSLENYRSSFENREILRILQKSTTGGENFLWQSHALGKTIVPIHHFEIDFVSREVVVTYDAKRYAFVRNLPIYVKLDYRTSVFKVPSFRESKNQLHFAFPVEIKTQELRTYPRHQFRPEQDKTVAIKPSLSGNRDAGSELFIRAVDISQYGLGVLVSEHNRPFLKNNRILWLTQLGSHKLEHPILSEVAYINSEVDARFLVRKQKELKVGLKLSGFIPSFVYEHFLQ